MYIVLAAGRRELLLDLPLVFGTIAVSAGCSFFGILRGSFLGCGGSSDLVFLIFGCSSSVSISPLFSFLSLMASALAFAFALAACLLGLLSSIASGAERGRALLDDAGVWAGGAAPLDRERSSMARTACATAPAPPGGGGGGNYAAASPLPSTTVPT